MPITSVVLSSQRAPMAGAIAGDKGAKAAATQAVNPLVQDGQKLIPSVTRVFSIQAATCTSTCRPTSRPPRPPSLWLRM